MKTDFKTVDEYIATFPKEIQTILEKLRKLVLKNAPEAIESISYGMPAYKTHGKPLAYFAALKNHISMKKKLILFLLTLCVSACNQRKSTKEKEELKKYDENGKLIVYNSEVYAKMWKENRNLEVTVIDTFCVNQTKKALRDIKNGKLIYFGFHPREFEKLKKMLGQHGIEIKKFLGSDVRLGGFEPYCYENEMTEEIWRKFGNNFIDSLFRIAQKEYIIENPNEEYIYDGVDLRAKYLGKSKPN